MNTKYMDDSVKAVQEKHKKENESKNKQTFTQTIKNFLNKKEDQK